MNDYRHILLATDYSEHNRIVSAKAKSLAACYGAKLSIVHVLDNIPMPDTNYGTVIPLDTNSGYDLLEAEKSKFLEFSQRLGIASANQWLIWGRPKQEICELAQQQGIDLLVIGAHAQPGLTWLLGSTADGILHHSPCDLLAVRCDDEP